jgi:hypothetical protein
MFAQVMTFEETPEQLDAGIRHVKADAAGSDRAGSRSTAWYVMANRSLRTGATRGRRP